MRVTFRPARPRAGFTLVELLVVLSIIAVLAALTTAAVMRFSGTGPRVATSSNLGKVLTSLNGQWKAVRDQAAGPSEPMTSNANQPFLNQAMTNTKRNVAADPRVKAEYVRLKLVQAFPTTFAEALDPAGTKNGNLAWPNYVRYLNKLGVNQANAVNAAWPDGADVQASVCVLMILEEGPKGGGATRDDLRATAVGPITLSNGQVASAILDGWRRPIYFTRSYNGQTDKALALLSVGNDGLTNGVNLLTFQPPAGSSANDNVLVNNP